LAFCSLRSPILANYILLLKWALSFWSDMRKGLVYISIAVIASLLGYFVKELESGIQPNYRWVRIHNDSGCEIKAASILFPDRTVIVEAHQMDSSVYPHGSESEINIPILASDTSKYRVGIEFKSCPDRISDPQDFTSGSHIEVWVKKDKITYGAR
jgi:hypothetical protein